MSLAGMAVMAGMLFLMSRMDENTASWTATALMVALGFGVGLVMPTMNVVAQNAVPMHLLGVVTSNLQFYRSIGGTMGVAVMGTIVTNHLSSNLRPLDPTLQNMPPAITERLRDPQALVNPDIRSMLTNAVTDIPGGQAILDLTLEDLRLGLADALAVTFLVGAILAALGFVVTLLLREVPLRHAPLPAPMEGGPLPEPGTAAVPAREPALVASGSGSVFPAARNENRSGSRALLSSDTGNGQPAEGSAEVRALLEPLPDELVSDNHNPGLTARGGPHDLRDHQRS
jgi:hypothetical protein